MSDSTPIDHRLVAYGTLAPGESNHHIVEPLGGAWTRVRVRGHRGTSNWRDYSGLPAFTPDPDADPVDVWLLEASALVDSWPDIDAFEGPGYERVPIDVTDLDGRTLAPAWIYQALHPD